MNGVYYLDKHGWNYVFVGPVATWDVVTAHLVDMLRLIFMTPSILPCNHSNLETIGVGVTSTKKESAPFQQLGRTAFEGPFIDGQLCAEPEGTDQVVSETVTRTGVHKDVQPFAI